MIALPDGASNPAWTSTSVTSPATGALMVAPAIWALRSATCCCASASWFLALSWPILAWRIWSVFPLSFAVVRVAFAALRPTRADARLLRAVVQLPLEVARVGGREDLALLHGVADLDVDLRDRVRGGHLGRRRAVDVTRYGSAPKTRP